MHRIDDTQLFSSRKLICSSRKVLCALRPLLLVAPLTRSHP